VGDPDRLLESAAGLGITPPEGWIQGAARQEEHFEVLPDCWDAVVLFLRCDTDWSVNQMTGQLLGLSRTGLVSVGRLMVPDPARLLEVLDDVRVIEAAVIANQPKPNGR
jgi:hypothetical protein